MNLSPIYKYGIEQNNYCQKIKDYYKNVLKMKKPKAFVKTYGCQQNVSDSEKYKGMLVNMGFDLTENQEEANVILFNTCAIRENAENKAFGNIGWAKNLKKANGNLFIILCGCMTEQNTILNKIKLKFSFPRTLSTFQVPKSCMWLVVTVLDGTGMKCSHHLGKF